MTVEATELPGVLLVTPKVFGDTRGYFLESYSLKRYREAGIDCEFVQDNVSCSAPGVIRGLHYQLPNEQSKLITVVSGAIFDVAVDVRRSSPTCGQWVGRTLSAENHQQLFIPAGFAHGFSVLGDGATVSYKCSNLYDPSSEVTIRWDDPDLGILWGVDAPIVSVRDQGGIRFKDLPADKRPS